MRSPTFDAQSKKADPAELFGLMQNRVPIDRLIYKNVRHLSRSLLIVDSLDCLLALFRSVFEFVIEIYISNKNKYQHQHKKNL